MTRTNRAMLAVPVTGRDHILGPVDAPITLVEHGDYECPHRGTGYPVVKELRHHADVSP